jgi:hypothetical protein
MIVVGEQQPHAPVGVDVVPQDQVASLAQLVVAAEL